MHTPRITIVTPSFNQAKYLPETIESILNQGYPNLEYIIIDGGSTDGSVDIIKKYKHHLFYWISEKDSGQSEAINKGLERATGDLFNWINSDDILFPGALNRIAGTFMKNPNVDLIVGDHARSDMQGRIIRISAVPSHLALSPTRWFIWCGQQSIFISTKTLKNAGGVRKDLHCIMDSELYYRIHVAGRHLIRVKGLIGLIREHPEAKGTARKTDWNPEKYMILKEYGIRPSYHKVDRVLFRLCRLLDGSYFRSYVLSQKWMGLRPWDVGNVSR